MVKGENRTIIDYLAENQIKKVLILCDKKVQKLYPDYFNFLQEITKVYWISLSATEKSKDITPVVSVWNFLLEQKFDRNSLLICWGGGTICDIGGMIAATFKRGIRHINIPTTLLSMIDAAHGGKNGVNLQNQKNIIGTFYLPEKVIIDNSFLKTLPQKEMLNGFAELIKYALIGNKSLWDELQSVAQITYKTIKKEWMEEAIQFKMKLVSEDLYDKGIRQTLNFGHTVGHAIERLFAEKKNRQISHGYAVAMGICYEACLSYQYGFITLKEVDAILQFVLRFYNPLNLSDDDLIYIANYCFDDKKNKNEIIRFIFLKEIGKAM